MFVWWCVVARWRASGVSVRWSACGGACWRWSACWCWECELVCVCMLVRVDSLRVPCAVHGRALLLRIKTTIADNAVARQFSCCDPDQESLKPEPKTKWVQNETVPCESRPRDFLKKKCSGARAFHKGTFPIQLHTFFPSRNIVAQNIFASALIPPTIPTCYFSNGASRPAPVFHRIGGSIRVDGGGAQHATASSTPQCWPPCRPRAVHWRS